MEEKNCNMNYNINPKQKREYIFVYGTLRDPECRRKLKLEDKMKKISVAYITGTLYDLGNYPGLILHGNDRIEGEIFMLTDMNILRIIDDYEQYYPQLPEESLYLRKSIRINEGRRDVWVYCYNKDIGGRKTIPSGSWNEYKSNRVGKLRY